jgi:hypothetical protein
MAVNDGAATFKEELGNIVDDTGPIDPDTGKNCVL